MPNLNCLVTGRNSLQLIVRSHQLPSDGHGYEVLHDGRCITVFSASNYGGSCYNAGAILLWEVCTQPGSVACLWEI